MAKSSIQIQTRKHMTCSGGKKKKKKTIEVGVQSKIKVWEKKNTKSMRKKNI